ncbi:MAG: UPF0016 domain-containing protein, partial [Synechococcus sp.]|nr:UPF0016 domain-containing protein [Synechococcus sp.]
GGRACGRLEVCPGSSSAFVLAGLSGAVAGGSWAAVIPAGWLQLAASTGFLVIGGRLLMPMLQAGLGSSQTED